MKFKQQYCSETRKTTIDDGYNSNDYTFESLVNNSQKDRKVSEKEYMHQLNAIEVSNAVYASVDKNRKTSNQQ